MELLVASLPYVIFVATVFGLVVGSFLNVCIYRIPRNISVNGNHGRSMCANCGKTLKSYDLIPLFSYLILGGKCRFCKKHISFRYPLVESINALLWGLCVWFYGLTPEMAVYAVFCSVLLVLSMIDLDTQEIPYRLQVIILSLGVISLFLSGFSGIKERLIGLVVVSVPMVMITLISGGFGGGDIQLMAVSGFLLGYQNNLLAMIIGTILAAIVGVFVARRTKKDEEKVKIPFGPFLSIGLISALFWGQEIYRWYFSFFL